MRFSLDFPEANSEQKRSLTPKEEVEWVPLHKHPVFTSTNAAVLLDGDSASALASRNLLSWDGSSRLYFWDSNMNCLHRLSIRLGEPDPTSVLAAAPSKILLADVQLNDAIHRISINRNGSALLLYGAEKLYVMYLYGRNSSRDGSLICRTLMIGPEVYYSSGNSIRLLKVLWHPYGDTNLGVLSSDSVFRIFNLSSDLLQPEQEYYLQPVEPGRSRNASSICPVDFSFGGDHLWDRFSVFILFSDGSTYILCPVVPFGSIFKWESILELYNDAHTFGLKSTNSAAANNSNMAISWLEATFPEIHNETTGGEDLSTLKAHAYAVFDSSVGLQGPLRKVCHVGDDDKSINRAECGGRAVSFLYTLVSKDSVLVTAWSGGQLQIDALADEIQPVWNIGNPPRLRVNSKDHIIGLAMICESITGELPIIKLDQPLDNNVWMGHPPPFLRLAIVDLALPKRTEGVASVSLFVDSLMPERIYSLHDGGVDSVVLHFLPFTSQACGKDMMRTPSVHPVLNTCQGETCSLSPLCGFVSLSDSFGYSWIVVLTLSRECIVLEMRTWNQLLPIQVDTEKEPLQLEEGKEAKASHIISKELLTGPKEVLTFPNLRSVAADSIEGRSKLHQYSKIFHENYVEYAHKVHFELKHHAPQLEKIIDDQHARLGHAQQKLLKVEEKQSKLDEKINHAVQLHNSLEERLQRLRKLHGAHRKPLSKAEREFKSELDHYREVELDALCSSIDALSTRMRRQMQTSKDNRPTKQISLRKSSAEDVQMSMLRSSLEKLSLLNSENSKKVKLVESALRNHEISSTGN